MKYLLWIEESGAGKNDVLYICRLPRRVTTAKQAYAYVKDEMIPKMELEPIADKDGEYRHKICKRNGAPVEFSMQLIAEGDMLLASDLIKHWQTVYPAAKDDYIEIADDTINLSD